MVDQVSLPTTLGEITVLPNHIPLITGLTSGDIVALVNGEYVPMAVIGGFLEVKQDKKGITNRGCSWLILPNICQNFQKKKIEKAKTRAEELKKQMENKEVVDYEHFAAELERSLTRVKIADKWRTKKYRK